MSLSDVPQITAKRAGTNATRGANDLPVDIPRQGNRWNRSNRQYITGRFGEVIPMYSDEFVPREVMTYGNDINLMMNRPLVSPMLTDVFIHRFVAGVSFNSIMPFTWKYQRKLSVNSGSAAAGRMTECPPDVAPVIDLNDLWAIWYENIGAIAGMKSKLGTMVADFAPRFMLVMAVTNLLRADGLLNRLGISPESAVPVYSSHGDDVLDEGVFYAMDDFLDTLGSALQAAIAAPSGLTFGGQPVFEADAWFQYLYVSDYTYVTDTLRDDFAHSGKLASTLVNAFASVWSVLPEQGHTPQMNKEVNIGILLAYQQTVAEFFTSDTVDDVYSCDRYMQVLLGGIYDFIAKSASVTDKSLTFTYEGAPIFYDAISQHFMAKWLNAFKSSTMAGDKATLDSVPYFCLLAFPAFSLKYGDYFTGGRLMPLSVGAGDRITVTANKVSTMDINRSILELRLRMAANRLGSSAREQLRGIFGIVPSAGDTCPKFLGHDKHLLSKNLVVSSVETADKPLGTLAANINCQDTMSTLFNTQFDDETYCIAFVYMDAKSVYPFSTYKYAFKKDYGDYFNEAFQNFGDVPIFSEEIDSRVPHSIAPASPRATFAYSPIFQDLRESFNRATGAFATDKALQSWFYEPATENNKFYRTAALNSAFLRTMPWTFNKFYAKTTHYGSKGYHFILDVQNICDSFNPASISPNVLMK